MISHRNRNLSSGTLIFALLIISTSLSLVVVTDDISSAPSQYEEDIEDYSNIEFAMIIGDPALEDEFQLLKEWREKTGLKSELFHISEILRSDNGRDDAEKLFNLVDQLYKGSGGKLRYLLLAGDSDLIPTRYLHAGAADYGLDDLYLSDVYYSSPGLDWDHDDDGIFGEREDIEGIGIENISFPIRVGRAPVSNETEALRFVERVISYETDPPEGSWTREGIISSSLMDTPNIIDDQGTPVDEGFNAYKDNGYKAILNYTLPYIPRSIDLIEAHDYTQYLGGQYSNENDTLDADTLPKLLSNGSSFFTFAGQSYYDVEYPVSPFLAYSLAQWIAPGDVSMEIGFDTALTHTDTWNLTNGGKLPVVYISSCDTANFSDPEGRDLSNLLYAPNGGAICLIGSTGISWRGEGVDYSLGNWYLMPRFWEKFVDSHRPGDSLYDLKQDYISSKWDEIATKEPLLVGLYTYNYIGDPALNSWLGSPKDMVVNTISSELFAGKDSFEVQVQDSLGTPLLEATVSLSKDGEIFKGMTGPDGRVDIPTEFTVGGNGYLTVTAKNFIPYQGSFLVEEEPSDAGFIPDSIQVSSLAPTEGVEITVSADVVNNGVKDLVDVEIGLYGSVLGTMEDLVSAEPVSIQFISIPANGTIKVSFGVQPLRSWSGLTMVIVPLEDELVTIDNIISMPVHINARPRFLPISTIDLLEDQGSILFDLSEHVFEPDGDDLDFTVLPGSPTWVTIIGEHLNISPPLNWSGTFSMEISVSDSISSDETTIYLNVGSTNDAPVLLLLESRYEAVVDRSFSIRLETLDAEGDKVEIDISSSLSSLKLSGSSLRFVPYDSDIGVHQVNISVKDPSGDSTNYTIILEVVASDNRLYFSEPSIHLPPAVSGDEYDHTISVGGDLALGATFADNTSLFDIDPTTGRIVFTPSDDDAGDHWVKITVQNGNTTITRTFLFRIDEGFETPTFIYWLLGGGIIIVLVLIISLYIWSGREMVQYGLEE